MILVDGKFAPYYLQNNLYASSALHGSKPHPPCQQPKQISALDRTCWVSFPLNQRLTWRSITTYLRVWHKEYLRTNVKLHSMETRVMNRCTLATVTDSSEAHASMDRKRADVWPTFRCNFDTIMTRLRYVRVGNESFVSLWTCRPEHAVFFLVHSFIRKVIAAGKKGTPKRVIV